MGAWQDQARKSAIVQPLSPILPLYDYERRVIADRSRWKGWVKSRQIGGSFTGTLDMVLDGIDRHDDWNTMSRTGRQAKKLLRKAAMHVEGIDHYVRTKLGQPSIIEKITTEEIVLKSGVIFSAVPCDADTTVGDTVNWLLDEWHLYPNSEESFGKIKPSTMHGKRIFGLSTPRGRKGKFADLYFKWKEFGPQSGWSFHVTTIEQAMREGLVLRDHQNRVITFEEFKAQEISDIGLEMWLQEYMCEFLDAISAFLSWEQIQACAIEGQPLVKTPEQLVQIARSGRQLYMGVDIGRRHDLTVFWIISVGPDGFYRTEAVVFLAKTPYRTQQELLAGYLKSGCITRACIDCTGIGDQLAEDVKEDFGHLVERVTFTNAVKLIIGERLRIQMESGNFSYPDSEDIGEDFASIERIITEQCNVRLAAARGNKTHGDFFWAAGMSLKAASDYGPTEVAMAAA